jgi:hypothetical protein
MLVAQAADVMGVHMQTVRNMITRGDLTVVGRAPRQGRPLVLLDPRQVRAHARRLANVRARRVPPRNFGPRRPPQPHAVTSDRGGNLEQGAA